MRVVSGYDAGMRAKSLAVGLLIASILVTVVLIVGSYVTYAPSVSATDMQNSYIRRTTTHGSLAIVLQAAALFAIVKAGRSA